MVIFLLDKGAVISAKDYRKWTALYLAAKGSIIEMVRMLISKGANIISVDKLRRIPLHYAA